MIVQVINPAPFGGLETVVTHLATGLHAGGHRSAVLVVLDEGDAEPRIVQDLLEAGVPTRVLRVRPRHYHRERIAIADALREMGATVMHSHGYRMDIMCRTVRGRVRAGWTSTLHGFIGSNLKGQVYERLQLLALRGADRVIGVSQTVIEHAVARGVPRRAMRLVRNAVPAGSPQARDEARRELGIEPGRRWVGWVGRLGAEKDPGLFAHAIRELPDPSIGGVIVGAGPLFATLSADHDDLVRAGRLVLAGRRLDASRLMPAFDALVLSSVTEGTPMVVLESMQSGIPVIATAVGGLPDVLGGGAGVLVPDRTPEALAAAIVRVLDDAPATAALVRAASDRIASQFSTAAWLSTHVQLYSELSAVHAEVGS